MINCESAAKLLGEGHKTSDIISIKLKLDSCSCWCFNHKPEFWRSVNEYLGTQGPIQYGGELLLSVEDEVYVLQCHGTGPEIIILATVSIPLVTAIVILVNTMVTLLKKEHRSNNLKVIKRKIVKNEMLEETIVELKVDDRMKESSLKDLLKQSIKKALE